MQSLGGKFKQMPEVEYMTLVQRIIYIHSSISFEKYDSMGTKFLPGVEALCPHFTACPPTYLYVPGSQGTVVYECMIINLSHGIGID
ncbi:Ankyrin repeat-containing protein P1E11.10 [Fusarium oxysporum f. sp. albedinis]|nr:Ankyrin repeat-containing protein P1E11.10 [Fusarium oxysporum f. sp. albedinis]